MEKSRWLPFKIKCDRYLTVTYYNTHLYHGYIVYICIPDYNTSITVDLYSSQSGRDVKAN